MSKPPFQENVTIITGASSGIGQELAVQLAAQGAWLALAARNLRNLAQVAAQCSQLGARVITIPTDVADQSSCRGLVQCTVAEYGRIDTLINNAGVGMDARFDELEDLEIFEKVFQVNFYGSVYCTYYALPYLKKTKGRLVSVCSGRGIFSSATADAYSPSKHAMVGFFNSLRLELAGSGVSVTMIYPGWVNTGISTRALKPDGTLTVELSRHEKNAMSAETCARIIVRAAARRKREVVMSFLSKLGLMVKPFAPGLVDQISAKETD